MVGMAAARLPLQNETITDDFARLFAATQSPVIRLPDKARVQQGLVAFAPFRVGAKSKLLFGCATGAKRLTCRNFGASILAQVLGARLGLIPEAAADGALTRQITALERLQLCDGRFPFHSYGRDLRPLKNPTSIDAGWSGPQILFVVTALLSVASYHPKIAAQALRLVSRWPLMSLVYKGRIWSVARPTALTPQRYSDNQIFAGWTGHPIAAAAGLLLNAPAIKASTAGVPFAPPTPRPPQQRLSHPAGLIEEGLLFGLDEARGAALCQFHLLMRSRFERDGQVSAPGRWHPRAEERAASGFIVNTGQMAQQVVLGTVALPRPPCVTATAFGFDALVASPYSRYLTSFVQTAQSANGWRDGCDPLNQAPLGAIHPITNLVVLLALNYRAFGPLLPL